MFASVAEILVANTDHDAPSIPEPAVSSLGWQRIFGHAALLLVFVLGFCRITQFQFVNWDDPLHVYANPYVASLSAGNLHRIWSAPYEGLYIPVTYTFLALVGRIAPFVSAHLTPTNTLSVLNPASFHAASVVLHFANCLLLARLLSRYVGKTPAALGAAILFAVHPLQVESLAWISELRGLLGAFFALASLLAYDGYARANVGPDARGRAKVGNYLVASIFLVLALLSKPSFVAIPLVAMALDRWAVGRSWRQMAAPLGAWLVAVVACVFLTRSAQPLLPEQITPLWQRPFVAGDALAFYLAKVVWPSHLTIDYGRTPRHVMAHWWGYVTWIAPAIMAFAAFRARRTRPLVWAGAFVFFVSLIPVSGLVPFGFQSYSTVADRYAYFPLVGAALVASDVLNRNGRTGWLGASAVCLAFLVLSSAQTSRWQNSLSLFQHAVAERPDSSLMRLNLGATLVNLGRDDEGLAEYREALKLDPRNAIAESNVGLILDNRGDLRGAEAAFRGAVASQPGYGVPHCHLGEMLVKRGKDVEALSEFEKAAAVEPDMADAHKGMADILMRHGQPANAVKELGIVARLLPDDPSAQRALSDAKRRYGL